MHDAMNATLALPKIRCAVNAINPHWTASKMDWINLIGTIAECGPNSQTAGEKNKAVPGISQTRSKPTQNSPLAASFMADARNLCSSGKLVAAGKYKRLQIQNAK